MLNQGARINPAGFAFTILAVCVGALFVYVAMAIDPPRLPDRQQTEDLKPSYVAQHPECLPAQIAKLREADRPARAGECATAQENNRLEKEGLTQAIRTTDATEEGVRLSFQQTRIAFVQAIMTVFALAFTGWAAWEASRAAKAAERSIDHADQVMRNELRAYVHLDRAEITWGHGGSRPLVKLFAKNTGQTPAKWFGAKVKIVATETDQPLGGFEFGSVDFTDRPMVSWSALGGQGAELNFYGTKNSDLPVLTQIYEDKKTINVMGVLT